MLGYGWKVKLAITMVFIGCGANAVFLELLTKEDPGIGHLVTFLSFAFVSLEGFIFTTKWGTVKPKIPIRAYAILVLMYFTVSVINNYALKFDIPMPLHMIFRSGSLIANMVLGVFILGKMYAPIKYLSVLLITLGLTICTLMTGRTSKPLEGGGGTDGTADGAAAAELRPSSMPYWASFLTGISLLTIALFMSAGMGIIQEIIYRDRGKHHREALFYLHFLPLACFSVLYKDIAQHWGLACSSELVALPLVGGGLLVPKLVLYLIGNTVTQHVCISAVFLLTTECPSILVTLVITLRKFCSLLFSIWYFQNPFTLYHWTGAFMVFLGTLIFSFVKDPPAKEKIG